VSGADFGSRSSGSPAGGPVTYYELWRLMEEAADLCEGLWVLDRPSRPWSSSEDYASSSCMGYPSGGPSGLSGSAREATTGTPRACT
jgi:hypothetical protein